MVAMTRWIALTCDPSSSPDVVAVASREEDG